VGRLTAPPHAAALEAAAPGLADRDPPDEPSGGGPSWRAIGGLRVLRRVRGAGRRGGGLAACDGTETASFGCRPVHGGWRRRG
jgi:hypothetical protein